MSDGQPAPDRVQFARRACWWLYSPLGPLLARRYPTLGRMVRLVREDLSEVHRRWQRYRMEEVER